MANQRQNMDIAKETLHILRVGFYISHNNMVVNIKKEIDQAIGNSKLYKPHDNIVEKFDMSVQDKDEDMNSNIEITTESTLEALKRLTDEGFKNIACLNFASAKNPGGGFQEGYDAQEESLARASGLYPCISQMQEMYKHNIRLHSGLYSDYMIYSPKVPVFRNDDGVLIDKPYYVSMITAPAVNAGLVRDKEEDAEKLIEETMINRIEKILALAVNHKQEAIVLGAYGCGVFRNRPTDIAEYFRKFLVEDDRFKGAFKKVVFAIYEKSAEQTNFTIFDEVLSREQVLV